MDRVSTWHTAAGSSEQNDLHAEVADGGSMVVDTQIHLDLWRCYFRKVIGFVMSNEVEHKLKKLPSGN